MRICVYAHYGYTWVYFLIKIDIHFQRKIYLHLSMFFKITYSFYLFILNIYIIYVKFSIYSFTFPIYIFVVNILIHDAFRNISVKKENLQNTYVNDSIKKLKQNIQTWLHMVYSQIIFLRWIAKAVTLVKILVSESLYRNIILANILHALRQRCVN